MAGDLALRCLAGLSDSLSLSLFPWHFSWKETEQGYKYNSIPWIPAFRKPARLRSSILPIGLSYPEWLHSWDPWVSWEPPRCKEKIRWAASPSVCKKITIRNTGHNWASSLCCDTTLRVGERGRDLSSSFPQGVTETEGLPRWGETNWTAATASSEGAYLGGRQAGHL